MARVTITTCWTPLIAKRTELTPGKNIFVRAMTGASAGAGTGTKARLLGVAPSSSASVRFRVPSKRAPPREPLESLFLPPAAAVSAAIAEGVAATSAWGALAAATTAATSTGLAAFAAADMSAAGVSAAGTRAGAAAPGAAGAERERFIGTSVALRPGAAVRPPSAEPTDADAPEAGRWRHLLTPARRLHGFPGVTRKALRRARIVEVGSLSTGRITAWKTWGA